MEDTRYPIELEVLTPLSVGAGNDNEWVRGIDFVQKDRKVYVIDMKKVADAGVSLDALTSLFLNSDEGGIVRLLGNRIGNLSRFVFDAPARTDNNIKTFLRTQFYNKPLVAGSSLKGSVRSALFNYLRTDEEKNEEVFGSMKDGTDFMRFIRVGDIELPETILVNTKIFNLQKDGREWLGGWKHRSTHTDENYNPYGFNTLYECVAPKVKGYGNISLASGAYRLLEQFGKVRSIQYASKKKELLDAPISKLFQIINEVTRTYLIKERKFFMQYPAERSEEVIDKIDYLLSLIPSDGSSCLLKMSAGVGFHSITGDWKFDDYDHTGVRESGKDAGKKKYKSRKVAEYKGRLQLMGFVRLRPLTTAEAHDVETTRQQRHQDFVDAAMAPIRVQEAERQKREAAERQRRLVTQENERKQQEYQALLQQAHQCFDGHQWEKAQSLLNQAASLWPEGTEHNALLEKCSQELALEANAQLTAQGEFEKFSKPLSEVIQGNKSAGNLVGTTAKWLKFKERPFGQLEYDAFTSTARQLPKKEFSKLKSKLSSLAERIGQETIDKIINDLNL